MTMTVRFIANTLAFIALLIFSSVIIGPVRLSNELAQAMGNWAIWLNVRTDDLYFWMMVTMHAFIAFVTLLFVRWCVRRYRIGKGR